MESLAFEQALIMDRTEAELGSTVDTFVAIGGGAASDTWRQIFADVTGKTVERSATTEATALGAGMCAAVGAGWFDSFADAASAMAGDVVAVSDPSGEAAARYAPLKEIYNTVYDRVGDLFGPLARARNAVG